MNTNPTSAVPCYRNQTPFTALPGTGVARLATVAVVATLAALPSLHADSAFWNGNTSAAWADLANWDGSPTTVPGAGDTATFDVASANTTVDLGGELTIDAIVFDTAGGTAYTLGDGGGDAFVFANNGEPFNAQLTAAATADQTIAADIWLGPDASANDVQFDLDSTTNKLVISGNIDTKSGGTVGVKRLEFGDFNTTDIGTVDVNGSISNTGGATRVDFFAAGAIVNLGGTVNGTGNTMRSYINNNGAINVNGTGGKAGEGNMEVRYGALNLNNTTTPQKFDNTLFLGDVNQGNGNATVTLASGASLTMSGGITYRADSGTANLGLVQGGTVNIADGNQTIIANNNTMIDPASPELTITSTIAGDGGGTNGDRDLTIRNEEGGTLLLAPSGTANSFGGVTLQEGTLQLGAGALSSEGDFVTLAARNHATTTAGEVATLDLMGTTHALGNGTGAAGVGGNLQFGTTSTNLITDNGYQGNVVDSVGGGKLTGVNQIIYRKGTGTGVQRNGGATISADLDYDISGLNKAITIEDGRDATDLTISSAINTTGTTGDDIEIIGDGTLLFSGTIGYNGTVNAHDRVFFRNRKTILGPGADPGGAANLHVEQRNNAAYSDFEVELDINGQDLVLEDLMVVSAFSTNNVVTNQSVRVTDSVGTGRIIFTGATDGARSITYNSGNTVGKENKTTFFSADVRTEGSGLTFVIHDGGDTIDLDLSGTITCDNDTRQMNKSNPGTLRLSATDNVYGVLQISQGTVVITNAGALGSDDIGLGNNNTDGTLEYTGPGEIIDEQVRLGDNNAAATRTGEGSIINNGTGPLTFTQATFTQVREDATVPRTLTLGGSNTGGDNTISGTILDNSAVGSTVGITKTGSNTWILSGNNSYTGDTNVVAGKLCVNGSVGGNLTVADGASFCGDATFGGTVTLGTSAATNLHIDGSTSAALTATGAIDTSNGVNVFVDAAGADDLVVLNYNNGAVGNNISTTHFTLDAGVAVSGRVGSAGPFVDSGPGSITIDLGFENKTWLATSNGDWDEGLGSTANWSLAGGDNLFYDGDLVTFGDDPASSPQTVTLTESVAPTSVTFPNNATTGYTIDDNGGGETLTIDNQMTVSTNGSVTINAVIAGNGSIYKGDNADGSQEVFVLTLNAANTYTGGTTIGENRVSITDSSALGTGPVTLSDDGAGNNQDPLLDLDADALNVANDIVLLNAGGAKLIRLENSGVQTGTLSGTITINETGLNEPRFQTGVDDTLTVSGLVTGAGGFVGRGDGTTVLANGSNSFIGRLLAGGGTLRVASIADSGVASHAGAGSLIVLGMSGGTNVNNNTDGLLSYTGSGASTDRQVQVGNRWFGTSLNPTNGGTISNDGSGPLVFTNAQFSFQESRVAADIGPRTLTLGGSFAGTNTIQGTILDNDATDAFIDESVSLDVDTAGTWALTAANSYTGDTTVTAGTLSLGNGTSNTALADGSNVSVASGALLDLNYSGTDTIDGLTLGGSAEFPGTWGATGSGATWIDDTYFTGTGTLTVTTGPAPSTYDLWAQANGLTGADALPSANPDGDAYANSEEFAYGFDPQDAGNPSGSLTVAGGVITNLGAPAAWTDPATMRVYLRYSRRADYATAGLSYTEEFSPDDLVFETGDDVADNLMTVIGTGTFDGVAVEAVQLELPWVLTDSGRKARFGRVDVLLTP